MKLHNIRFTLIFEDNTNELTVESNEADSISFEIRKGDEENTIILNKKEALLVADVIKSYFREPD